MPSTLTAEAALAPPSADVTELYDVHAEHVWRSLHRLGIPERDLPDTLQEVFVVVHRRAKEIDPERNVRGFLAVGLARNYHKKRARQRTHLSDELPERADREDPESALSSRRSRERGRRMLAELDPEKRAVFVMFEVEGLSGKTIAEELGVPLGTVHSRLHAARRELTEKLAREEER